MAQLYNTSEHVDHGLSLPGAYNFTRYMEREQAFLNTPAADEETAAIDADDPYAHEISIPPAVAARLDKDRENTKTEATPLTKKEPEEKKSQVAPDGKVIFTISPDNVGLEFIFTLTSDDEESKELKFRAKTISFEDNGESITFMMDKLYDFDLPVLSAFRVKLVSSGRMYWVLYVGGSCMMGPYKFVSLVKTNPPVPRNGKGRNGSRPEEPEEG